MAEDNDTTGVGHTILAANKINDAVNRLDKAVEKLATVVDKMSGAADKISNSTSSSSNGKNGSAGGGAWNAASNWLLNGPNANGGGATFGGARRALDENGKPMAAQTPGWATSAGNFANTMAKGNGGWSVSGGFNMGRALTGTLGGGLAGAAIVGGTQAMMWGANNGVSASTMSQYDMQGGTVNSMYTAGAAYYNGTAGVYGSKDTTDYNAMRYNMSAVGAYAPGSANYQNQMAVVGGMGIMNPNTTGVQNSQAYLSLISNRTVNSMKAFGINTYNKSPQDVARQLMNRLGYSNKAGAYNSDQIKLLTSQNASLSTTLQNMVANGSMTQEGANAIQDAGYADLMGQKAGVSSAKMGDLFKRASNHDTDAMKQLQAIDPQFGKTLEQQNRNRNADSTKSSEDQLKGFTESLKTSNALLHGFNSVLRKIPNLETAVGISTQHGGGLWGGTLGDASLAYHGLKTFWSLPGKAIGGVLNVMGEGGSGAGSDFSSSASTGFSGYGGFSEAAAISAGMAGFSMTSGGMAGGIASTVAAAGGTGGSADTVMGFGGGSGGVTGPVGGTTSGNASQQSIVSTAKRYLGVKYLWGGTSPSTGFDCSGFAQYVFAHNGINLPRTAAEQSKTGSPVNSLADAQPGDLVFFGSSSIEHVGIYVGGGKMIDAPHTGSQVRYDNVAGFNPPFRFVKRFVKGTSSAKATGSGKSYASGTGGKNYSTELGSSTGALAGVNLSGAPAPYRADVKKVLGMLNLGATKSHIDTVMAQMSSESAFNMNAVNNWDSNWKAGHPSVGLMQVIKSTFDAYAGPYKNTGQKLYGVSTDPMANIYAGLNYASHRYGSEGMWSTLGRGHGYKVGAWEIKDDETARVHKGEMIIPKDPADQIRQVLLQNNTTNAGKKTSSDSKGGLHFHDGAIRIIIQGGGGVTAATGRGIGQRVAQELAQDARIKALLNGN